ncbi:chemotaxis protein CheA [Xanthobacter sp. DSM 24535]|uniref:chemotaxis protein CheA n=1 Tax=Roseixanthobacter psychrophilus TaxID=3119917 RepID=UPI00372C64B6
MNELLQQFLIEARELVAQATDDLLALERTPDDIARLDNAFRAFHTLKGGAGIVDFAAMARALHAAEDALASSRTRTEPIMPARIEDYLACLDQIERWLDHMETTGAPPDDADASATRIVQRFEPTVPAAEAPAARIADAWVQKLLNAPSAGEARTALRYRPAPDCFFDGEDPMELMAALPGLLALRFEAAAPWPTSEELDPFVCRLTFTALLSSPSDLLSRLFETTRGRIDMVPLGVSAPDQRPDHGLTAPARALLEAQLGLLAGAGAGAARLLSSAGQVCVNVLRHEGATRFAERISHALAASEAANDAGILSAAISLALTGAADPPLEATATNTAPEPPVSATATKPIGMQEASARTLRIDVARVDALVKLAGELTVAKNAVGHLARLARGGTDIQTLAASLKDQHAVLDRLMGDLRGAVLSLRILPLRHAFQRFPRIVREISAELGKPVRLVLEGEATEADKTIVEALPEPLLHVVRNALDHGIEAAARRGAAGKPTVATLHLRAARQGEQVIVEVKDDGGGIDVARVREIAVARGIATAQAIAGLSDEEAVDLIFRPGFSTAATVTDLSGRGVGMDAVRTSVARLGGTVHVESQPGQGTTVRFALPFTVMVTQVMTVHAGGQVFGIPMDMIVETVRVPRQAIRRIAAAEAFALRNRTVPLVSLAEALGETAIVSATADANVVIVGMGAQIGGLEVDGLGERLDVILQPLDGILSGMPGLAGTSLLGDGRVLLVLDVREMLK